MDQRQAFMQSIIEAPDDDTPRLVFADWLEDEGDETRAEFIRTQIAKERLEPNSPAWVDLEQRAADLLEQNRRAWQEGLPHWARTDDDPDYGQTFRRGFVHRVEGIAQEFIDSWEALFTTAPIAEARIRVVGGEEKELADCPGLARLGRVELVFRAELSDIFPISSILASPHLSRLRGLVLAFPGLASVGATEALRDAEAEAIASCPGLSSLEELGLAYNRIGPDGISALVGSPHLARLTRLNLQGNPFGDDAVKRLARSPLIGRLTLLALKYIAIGDAGVKALAEGGPRRLERLEIGGGRAAIGNAGMRALARCEALANLRELDLDDSPLNAFRIRELARSRHLAGLRYLNLSDTGFDDEMARELAASKHLRNLRVIDLQRNRIGTEGLVALVNSPVLRTVTSLILFNNEGIGDEGAIALAASENLPELRTLCFVSVGLGLKGVRALAASPNLPNLQSLDIQDTPFGDEGAKALLESPHLRRIRHLALYDCGISETMAEALHERFGTAVKIFLDKDISP